MTFDKFSIRARVANLLHFLASEPPRPRYRSDIDGLRAVAILGVLAYHIALPGISGGFLGVDVFFVISGYLITQLLYKQLLETDRISLADFYARRARRLLPALLTVLLVTLALGRFLLPPFDRVQLVESALASLAFVANQYLLSTMGGYFDGPSDLKPLLHLWSLSVEEQFYLIWPLVLIVIARVVPLPRRLIWVRIAVVVIFLSSLAFSIWLKRSGNSSMAFFSAPSRAWELATGALVAMLPAIKSDRTAVLSGALSWIGALMICAAYCLTSPADGFQVRTMLLCVIGTGMLIYGNDTAPDSGVRKFLSHRAMISIGKISYSWYLWHWPLIALASNVMTETATRWVHLECVLVAMVLAILTWKYIENPFRHPANARSAGSARTLRLAGFAIVLVSLVGTSIWIAERVGPRTERERVADAVYNDAPVEAIRGCLIEGSDSWSASSPNECPPTGAGQPGVAVWGDSHAMMWAPMIESAYQSQVSPPTMVQFTMAGCQPLFADAEPNSKAGKCNAYARAVMPELLRLRAAGLRGVILGGRWSREPQRSWSRYGRTESRPDAWELFGELLSGSSKQSPVPTVRYGPEYLRDGLTPVLASLASAGLKVLILLDVPEVHYPLPSCVYYHFNELEKCGVSRREYDSAFGADRAMIKSIAASYADVRVFDPVGQVCTDDECPAFWQGNPILMDDNHVAASVARALAPAAEADLRWLLQD